ncbi:MAG TPA: hypothetical protein VFE07_10510 [Marmoricola sp.]|jgi:hypothetical protein|nr:hypothetical protein [Marmoricola sp.]
MADDENVAGTPHGDEAPTAATAPIIPTDTPAPATGPVLVPRLRDRVWSFRAMLAVALATLLIGGIAGGAIVAVADDGNDGHSHFLMGPGGRADRMPPGWRMPRRFKDGGPQWRWNDGPQPPGGELTPYGQPSPPAPSPSE